MATYRPGSNTLLKSDSILDYVLHTTVYPREHERLRELRLITQNHPRSFMGSSPDQMQFFSVLLKMIGARNAVEVGVFTGYSLLATALALPDDGKVVAIDVSREYYELGRPVIENAGVAHKVDFRHGDGLAVLDQLLAGGDGEGKFDFAYADADKEQYRGYHERLVRLVRVGGVVAYDNTLWGGSVAMPRDTPGSSAYDRVVRDYMVGFNAMVAADDRVEACLLPVADGVTLCRRLNLPLHATFACPPSLVKLSQRSMSMACTKVWRSTIYTRRLKRTTPASRVSSTAMAAANGDASHGANGGIQIQSKEMKTAIHSNDSPKTLLKSESLHEYMLNTMVYPRENEFMRELRLITSEHTYGFMSSPPEEGQLLSLLLKLTGAKNTIEVGVFTGCSVLATALAIPDDGKVVAIDVSREYFDLGLPVIKKAGVAHKVDFREGAAMPILDNLLANEENEGKFDFAFVDADKGNYGEYHERLLRLVRAGGVLAYDNTLWGGSVALEDDSVLEEFDQDIRRSIVVFNAKIAGDPRVEAVQLPVSDGITLCRRLV
uniref:tricin synthase n=1 Tax=Oryza meridionalis TaxID=40149 RepID=A0A0E0EN10_9ORYZ